MREPKTAVEIRTELVRLIREGIEARGKVDNTDVGFALRHPTSKDDGCNWYISYLTNAADHMMDVGAALVSVKKRWNLDE
jgi:hypothetical protein